MVRRCTTLITCFAVISLALVITTRASEPKEPQNAGVATQYVAPQYIAPQYIAPQYIAPQHIASQFGSQTEFVRLQEMMVQLDKRPSLDEGFLAQLTDDTVAELKDPANQFEVTGPLRVLGTQTNDGQKQTESHVFAGSMVTILTEQDDADAKGVTVPPEFKIEAGDEVFQGELVASGIVVNLGPETIRLQDSQGNVLDLRAGELAVVKSAGGGCSVGCPSGTCACCAIVQGVARCICYSKNGPVPEFGCQSGGCPATECSVFASQ